MGASLLLISTILFCLFFTTCLFVVPFEKKITTWGKMRGRFSQSDQNCHVRTGAVRERILAKGGSRPCGTARPSSARPGLACGALLVKVPPGETGNDELCLQQLALPPLVFGKPLNYQRPAGGGLANVSVAVAVTLSSHERPGQRQLPVQPGQLKRGGSQSILGPESQGLPIPPLTHRDTPTTSSQLTPA